MAEVVISFRRPPTMTAAEMHAWVIDRALVRQRALVLSGPEGSGHEGLRLRVEVDDEELGTAEEELADLMMDMRLLGLRPAVIPPAGSERR
ncbi:MAG TPA: hypothetical protein VKR21_17790 [Solirubrobacteraceae bacterium]|nr:hypothetical protein [Solirubrobacteraceae bacterium]